MYHLLYGSRWGWESELTRPYSSPWLIFTWCRDKSISSTRTKASSSVFITYLAERTFVCTRKVMSENAGCRQNSQGSTVLLNKNLPAKKLKKFSQKSRYIPHICKWQWSSKESSCNNQQMASIGCLHMSVLRSRAPRSPPHFYAFIKEAKGYQRSQRGTWVLTMKWRAVILVYNRTQEEFWQNFKDCCLVMRGKQVHSERKCNQQRRKIFDKVVTAQAWYPPPQPTHKVRTKHVRLWGKTWMKPCGMLLSICSSTPIIWQM